MSGRMIFASTTELFLWNAGGGVTYKFNRQQIPISKPSNDLKLIALQEVFVERRGRRSLQKCQRAKADYAKRTG